MRGSLYKFPAEKFPALTGIRAIAAYLVFFHHYARTPQVSGPLWRFLGEGHVGVTLFYVLSGFLITYNYSQKVDLGRGFWFRYVSRRVGRIYPLYFFLLALTYVVMALENAPPTGKQVLLNVTLWKGFFDSFKFDGISPSWSLTVEETFYFLAPFLFLAVRRIGHIGVQIALYATGGMLLLLGSNINFDGFFGNFPFVASYTFFGRSFEFVLGMALGQAVLRHPELLAASGRRVLTYLGIGGFAAVVFWMSLFRQGDAFGVAHPVGMALNNFALPVFVCILFSGLLSERTLFGRILGSAPLVFLGRASYAFYLVHYGVLAVLVGRQLRSLDARLQVGILFVAVNAISAVLFLLVEHPANALIRRWADRLADKPSRPKEIAAPGRRLRRLAVIWTFLFLVVFAVWSNATYDWMSRAVSAVSARAEGLQTQIDIPQFAHPLSLHTDFGSITSRVGQIPNLTYTVGGEPISGRPFIFAHANSILEYDISRSGWAVYEFSTGLDDLGGADAGSVIYIVRGDGKEIFRSPVVRSLQPPHWYSVNVSGRAPGVVDHGCRRRHHLRRSLLDTPRPTLSRLAGLAQRCRSTSGATPRAPRLRAAGSQDRPPAPPGGTRGRTPQ